MALWALPGHDQGVSDNHVSGELTSEHQLSPAVTLMAPDRVITNLTKNKNKKNYCSNFNQLAVKRLRNDSILLIKKLKQKYLLKKGDYEAYPIYHQSTLTCH